MKIRYIPLPGATPDAEIKALASAYAFLLRCREDRETAETGDERGELAARGHAERDTPVEREP